MKVYKNGNSTAILDTTFTSHFNNETGYKTVFGRAGEYNNYYTDATIDEVRLSSTNRSTA